MKTKYVLIGFILGSLLLLNSFSPAALKEDPGPVRMVLVLDASGSMWGQIDGKAKIVIAKEVLSDLIDGLPDNIQAGLSVYGHRAKGDCRDIETLIPVGPIDRKAMKTKVANISPKGKTPLSEAVRQAAQALRYTEEKATVVLLSDGLETCDVDPCALAAELAMSGVDFKVHVIGFDMNEEEQARLRCLADRTGGLFLAAGDAQSLRDALGRSVAKAQEPPPPVVEDPGKATLKGPASAPVGAGFEVTWEGPNSRNDYIAIAAKDSEDSRYIDYAYTDKGNPARLTAPGVIGDYELRYVHAHSHRVIARADFTATPVKAGVEPPDSAQVAAKFEVKWQGPGYKQDYITISQPGDSPGRYDNYAYPHQGNPVTLRAPSDPGPYEVRYILGVDTKILARAPITITAVEAQVFPPDSAMVAEAFEVRWQGPANEADYITIAKPDDSTGQYDNYAYTRSGNPVKLIGPATPGTYQVRYILGQGTRLLAQAPITITAVTAQVQPPASVAAGADFKVAWQGPGYDQDYLTVAKPDDKPGRYDNYAYPRTGNPVQLQAPADPGTYEVRYILAKGTQLLARASITVTPVSAVVKAPATVAREAEFGVEFNGPSYKGDYVTIVKADAPANKYLSYFYTGKGSPGKLKAPKEPGIYEVRYIMDKGKKILGRVQVTVE